MTTQKKEVSEWIRNHIIVCGAPCPQKEQIQNAILEHLTGEEKEEA